jgi:hypothetical protein
MWEVREGATILIYAPHNKLNGKRTIYTSSGSEFDHNPYKPYVTTEARQYHTVQVRTPSQVACGKSDIPEFAFHHVIQDDKFVIMTRNHKGKRCYALVNSEDISFVD